MKIIQAFFLLQLSRPRGAVEDYWDEDYDNEKNCISQQAIEKLKELKLEKKQCHGNMGSDPVEALQICRNSLSSKLIQACSMTKVKKAGNLLYCRNRGVTTCCFDNHQCESSWDDIEQPIPELAAAFLDNKEETLKKIKKELGFDTCHAIKGYDASKCAEDCKNIESSSSNLAKRCKAKKGHLKCCIRRDKRHCHECRYCCTLQFCSYVDKDGDLTHIGENDIVHGNATSNMMNKNGTENALSNIYSRDNFLKRQDTRCLKPYSDDDPEKWEHYDPDDFADAVDEAQLSKAKSVKFDKRFFNLEDPAVFEKMTGKDFKKQMKETYGFDFVARLIKSRHPHSHRNRNMVAKCAKNCIKAEYSNFAKKCRNKGGLFKCCISRFSFEVFENTRKELKKMGKISKTTNVCGEKEKISGICTFCTSSYFCSSWDRETNSVTQEYKTPEFNNVGGINVFDGENNQRYPLKTSWCIKPDFCTIKREEYYNPHDFLLALNRKNVCDAHATPLMTACNITVKDFLADFEAVHEKGESTYQMKELEETQEDCVKRGSNVRICPKSLLKENHASHHLKDVNKELAKTQRRARLEEAKKNKKKKSKKHKKKIKKSSNKKAKKKKHKKKKKKKHR